MQLLSSTATQRRAALVPPRARGRRTKRRIIVKRRRGHKYHQQEENNQAKVGCIMHSLNSLKMMILTQDDGLYYYEEDLCGDNRKVRESKIYLFISIRETVHS